MAARKPGAAFLRAVPINSEMADGNGERPVLRHTGARVQELDWSIYMARAQNGDREAYRRLLDDLTPFLRSLAARRFYVEDDVEDAVQEILLTIHAIRHTYDPSRPFGPWLVAIANRRIVDSMRRLGRSRSREKPLDEAHEACAAPAAEEQFGLADIKILRQAVEQLPQAQREAIRMLKLEEMSLKEASAASGTSITALKVSTHRALQKLRAILRKDTP